MSKYAVGDKVLVEGEIREIQNSDCNEYPYRVLIAGLQRIHFSEDELRDASKTYEDGLNDAWKLARKIVLKAEMGGICYDDFKKIFGVGDYVSVLRTLSPQQALAKIEAYEKSKQIEVGDVVRSLYSDNKEGICVGRGNNGREYALVWFKEYDCPQNMSLKDLKKTGRHIDIEHLLEQIRGDEDDNR